MGFSTRNDLAPDAPRRAATLVILRDGDHGLEVLVTTRPQSLRFMGGAVVFPGGAVAPADSDPRWAAASTLSAAEAREMLVDGEDALAQFICGLREACEEVGFVIGTGDLTPLLDGPSREPDNFLETCLAHGIRLATDLLVPAGRWVTPLGAPVRFDTVFFVTQAPPEWTPRPDPAEVEDCRWVTPSQALAELSSGLVVMAPPTIEMLQRLDSNATAGEATAALSNEGVTGPGRVLTTRLSPLVQLVLAPNPGLMTGPGTNSYVVGTGPTCVIDPAVTDDDYMRALRELAGDVAFILITHRHADHIGGAERLARESGAPVRAFGDNEVDGVPVRTLGDEEEIVVGGTTLRALHTPGHASDHLCFWMESSASLFSGDNILGEGTAVIAPPDGNMADYLASLRRLRDLHINRIYPAHFRPLHGGTRVIDDYLEHRARREAAILESLAGGPLDLDGIVVAVYTDTPQALHAVARFSAQAHLEMLQDAGRVRLVGNMWKMDRTVR
ncbi:MAG: MBL fold metallo-hydrolase [Actinomycetota bacterium]